MNDATASNPPVTTAVLPPVSAPVVAATPSAPAVTPGWQTSEFWMTALGQMGLILAASSGALPARYAALAAASSQVAYSLSRGIAKSRAASSVIA